MQQSKENEDLIFSAQELLIEKEKKYDFSFYLTILLECFATKYNQRHLKIFKPDKIEKIGELPEKKIKIINNILNTWANDPNKVLGNIDEDKRDEYGKYLFGIILFFTYNFKEENTQP